VWDLTPTEKRHAAFDIQLARADVAPYAFAPSPPPPPPGTPAFVAPMQFSTPAAFAEPTLDSEPRALEPKTEGSHTVSPSSSDPLLLIR
jgi:hypothetical protein